MSDRYKVLCFASDLNQQSFENDETDICLLISDFSFGIVVDVVIKSENMVDYIGSVSKYWNADSRR